MIKITEALTAEHAVFLNVFDQIERMLPEISTLKEARRMASLVEGLLNGHASSEDNLVYPVLDHALEHAGQLHRMHQEHEEIDFRLKQIHSAKRLPQARLLLKAALAFSREHFKAEEHYIFPVVEKILQRDTLTGLGEAWLQKRAS